VLCEWTADPRADVRAAALEALAHTGLDDRAARLAIDALESAEPPVRAMAAFALNGWTGAGDAPRRLAQHLDDTWMVAVRVARALQSMREAGRLELERCASRSDLPGELARQILWEASVLS